MNSQAEKILRNIHWILILYAIYSSVMLYMSHAERLVGIQAQVPDLESQIEQIHKKRREIEKFLKDIEESKKRVDAVAQQVELLTKKLPDEINETKVLETLSSMANQVSLKKLTFETGEEMAREFLYAKNFTFKGSGTFLQFMVFLENLANQERIFNIKSIKMSKNKTPQKGRFQTVDVEGVIEAYRFNPNYREDRGFDKIEQEVGIKKNLVPAPLGKLDEKKPSLPLQGDVGGGNE